MAASGGEKSGLGKFVKNQTKYGTATKSTHTNDTFFKYQCSKGETLQGIALKHGVTMEQIKRANNIWTNESLFLREYLLIPIINSKDKDRPSINGNIPGHHGQVESTATDTDASLEIVTRQELQAASRAAQCKTSKTKSATDAEAALSKDYSNSAALVEEKDSAFDFLNRMDSSLAQIKTKVKELDSTSEFPVDQTNPLNHLPHRKSSSLYGKRPGSRRSVDSDTIDPLSEPQLTIRSRGHDRRIQTSLDKLEQQQDDIFQL